MTRSTFVALLVCFAAVTACSRNKEMSCESNERYTNSTIIPPVRVPDDLTVPDETDSLRIPDRRQAEQVRENLPCLETPPDFFGGQNGGGA
jgi:uncharacterized lipoprotein